MKAMRCLGEESWRATRVLMGSGWARRGRAIKSAACLIMPVSAWLRGGVLSGICKGFVNWFGRPRNGDTWFVRAAPLLLFVIGLGLAAQVAPPWVVASTDVIPGFDARGARTFPVSRVMVDVSLPRSLTQKRFELTVVRDPGSGYFLWHVIGVDPGRPETIGVRLKALQGRLIAVFAEPDRLLEIYDPSLVRVWRGRAESMDAAIAKSVEELRRGAGILEGKGSVESAQMTSIRGEVKWAGSAIFRDFRCAPDSSICPDKTTIEAVTKSGARWRILLRNRFDLEVVLDEKFDLIDGRF